VVQGELAVLTEQLHQAQAGSGSQATALASSLAELQQQLDSARREAQEKLQEGLAVVQREAGQKLAAAVAAAASASAEAGQKLETSMAGMVGRMEQLEGECRMRRKAHTIWHRQPETSGPGSPTCSCLPHLSDPHGFVCGVW